MGRRRRLAVVVYVPEPERIEVDVLRRAFGDPTLSRIAPHITLVPPVNVDPNDVNAAVAAVDAAAQPDEPFAVTLGPPATFLPVTPVLYLAVGGDDARELLGGQRTRAFVAPLARPIGRDFVPHVTLGRAKREPHRVEAGVTAFAQYEASFLARYLTLVELIQPEEGPPVWTPIHEAPLGGPDIVARGPMQLELSVTSVVSDDALALLAATARRPQRDAPALQRVVTARRDGELLGVALGRLGRSAPTRALDAVAVDAVAVDVVAVAEPHRGQGVATHLLRHLQSSGRG